jgi:hypothetical protein
MRFSISGFDAIAADPDALHHRLSQSASGEVIALADCMLAEAADDVVEIRNAIVLQRGGILWKHHWIDGNSIHYYARDWAREHWRPGDPDQSGRTIDIPPDRMAVQTTVHNPVMFCDSGLGARNFGHFVHDFLPYGDLYHRLRDRVPTLQPLANAMRWDSQAQIMAGVFGVAPTQFNVIAGNTAVAHLFLPRRQSVLEGPVWTTSFTGLRAARSRALRRFGIDAVGDRPTKVFLHRKPNPDDPDYQALLNGRNFGNVDAVAAALLDRGFVALEPGMSPIESVAALVARADTVIGVHGANMGNILFCPPGCRIMELRPASGVWGDYEALARVLGHEFVPLVQPPPPEGAAPLIDVAGLLALLETSQ